MSIEEFKAARGETNGPVVEEKEREGEPALDTTIIPSDIKRFAALFCGHDQFYGGYNSIATVPDEAGKLIGGRRETIKTPVTPDLYLNHVTGAYGVGICPVRADATSYFGAIDVDQYNGGLDHTALAKKIEHHKLPLVVCRSKSGGAHCYCFALEPIPAALMISKFQEMAGILSLAGAEIFPKQKTLPDTDFGSWINLPYFNGMLAARYAVGTDGPMDLEEFLGYAESIRQNSQWFKTPLVVSTEMPQGPPCLQHLIQIGFPPHTRNQGLFNLGVYYRKLDPDGWKPLLEAANRQYMKPPLDTGEIATLIKSVGRKDYRYKCAEQPLCGHCNASLCRTRKFGIGGNTSLPDFGPLTKIETDPPTWVWTVNGLPLTLTTDQLLDPYLFQKASADKLTAYVDVLKRDEWGAVVKRAMAPENVTIERASEDATAIGRFKEELASFSAGRSQAFRLEEINSGRPYEDTDNRQTYFRLEDLILHLNRRKFNEFRVDAKEVSNRLRELKAVPQQKKMLGKWTRYWRIASFSRQTEPFKLPDDLERAF